MLRKWNWRLSARQIAGKSPLDYALEAGNAEISGLFFGLTIASFQESCAHPRDHAALKKRSPRAENNPKTKDICHFQPFRSSMLQSFPGGWLAQADVFELLSTAASTLPQKRANWFLPGGGEICKHQNPSSANRFNLFQSTKIYQVAWKLAGRDTSAQHAELRIFWSLA